MNSISREQKVLEIFLPKIFLPSTHAASMSRGKATGTHRENKPGSHGHTRLGHNPSASVFHP